MKVPFYRSLTLILFISIFTASYVLTGCNKDDEMIVSGDVTDVNVNGSLSPTNHTTARGNLFVTDQNGNPLSITSNDVSAVMTWTSDDPAGTSNGTVTINSVVSQDIAAAITMDYSGSMYSPSTLIPCMVDGVSAYINAMSSNDLAEIIKFSTSVSLVRPFTNNKTDLLTAVQSTANNPSAGSTALYESIYNATNDVSALNSADYLRAVIAFTDGGENASSVTRAQMISQALNYAIPVFTITLLNGVSPDDMKNIADTTGGFAFTVLPDSCNNISNIYTQINNQVNNAYSMSITWPNFEMPAAGTLVTVTVSVTYGSITKSFTKSYVLL